MSLLLLLKHNCNLICDLLEGSWIWSDKSSSSYRNWRKYAGEPNNLHGREDCAGLSSDFGGHGMMPIVTTSLGFYVKKVRCI